MTTPGDDERGGGAPTLVELIGHAAAELEIASHDYHRLERPMLGHTTGQLAAALRAAGARLAEEMRKLGAICADPAANAGTASYALACVAYVNGGPLSALPGRVAGQGTESQSESGPSAPTPAPVTGMEPGRRCTFGAGHDAIRVAHVFDAGEDAVWRRGAYLEPRCPYVEGALVPVEPATKWSDRDALRTIVRDRIIVDGGGSLPATVTTRILDALQVALQPPHPSRGRTP